ncbi:unnamed protein product [Caenorhabditis bovis]|uniref:FYVE-type domain-containing protein n=1 Tax=Caenorhabditis bovis TaxID=2654633 RepID=A0A8S1EN35_9PELO|nr:unnamed protein product [Caenorhabditis bovis]
MSQTETEADVPIGKSPNPALSCEMCQNYEINLTNLQNDERKIKEELNAARQLTERYESDLSKEREYRKEMERKMSELSAQTNDKVNEAVKLNFQLEQKLSELKAKHEKAVEAFTDQLNNAHLTIKDRECEFAEFFEKYQKLLGVNKKSANQMSTEEIELPADVEQLQFICLKTREELIQEKSAKEHLEQTLTDEVAMLREQLKEERAARQASDRDYMEQINGLQTSLGVANSKISSTANALAQHDAMRRQIHDLQTTIGELEDQVKQVQNERAAVEMTAQNYKQRCANLQNELETSEIVQKDFVKLSQSLQIELEKIRQSEQEVRWQWDEDVEKCTGCETSVVKLKPRPHCMHCGKIFCTNCLNQVVKSGPNQRPANVCHVCHTLLNPDSKPFFATQDVKK